MKNHYFSAFYLNAKHTIVTLSKNIKNNFSLEKQENEESMEEKKMATKFK